MLTAMRQWGDTPCGAGRPARSWSSIARVDTVVDAVMTCSACGTPVVASGCQGWSVALERPKT